MRRKHAVLLCLYYVQIQNGKGSYVPGRRENEKDKEEVIGVEERATNNEFTQQHIESEMKARHFTMLRLRRNNKGLY